VTSQSLRSPGVARALLVPAVMVRRRLLPLVIVASCHSLEPQPVGLTSADVRLDEVRHEHEELRRRLDETEKLVDALVAAPERRAQTALARRVVAFFSANIGEHGRWEETMLHDRRVALRAEHHALQRMADEIAEIARGELVDPNELAARSRFLIVRLRNHLDEVDARLAQ